MENNKIVKNLTKALIIALCCILPIGALSISTYAYDAPPTDINWDDTYLVFYNRTYEDVSDGGLLTFAGIDNSYRYKTFEGTMYVTHSYKPITYDDGGVVLENGVGYFILDIIAHVGDHIQLNNGEYLPDTFDDFYEITGSDLVIGTPTSYPYRPVLTLHHFNNSQNNQELYVRVKVYVGIESDPYDDPLYLLGYEEGYQAGSSQGFNDAYNTGYLDGLGDSNTNGFIETLFRPITALHSAIIYDINGSAQGGEISIGAIFISILALCGLTAFLKHFAGG